MKTRIIAMTVVLSMWASVGKAIIESAPVADDGDGAVVCGGTWDEQTYTMNIVGNQYWGPGHIGELPLNSTAAFITDTETDPIVKMRNTIENDTGFAWTGYHVNIYMNKSFSLSEATVYTPDTSELGWSGTITTTPAQWNGTEWVGQVDFTGGNPIPNGGTLEFSYKMEFIGTVQYCQEMIPVPEPSTLVLLSIGAVSLLGAVWLRRGS